MAQKEFVPYIPPEKTLPEFTFKVVLIGAVLTIVMASANAYLGLYAGMTVSATIPALVMAVAVMRPLKGSILETNLSKSIAVTGEALAAGVIFTFPALLVLYWGSQFTGGAAGWENLMDNIPIMIIGALIGGILGILLTIPLRRVMIIDLDLPYPEGVASAEVLKATERGGRGMGYIMGALGIGAGFKLAGTGFGLNLWREKLEGVVAAGPSRLYGGLNLSPALLGVGYILGLKIASLVFLGGVIGWIILNPSVGAVLGYTSPGVKGIYDLWFSDIMFVGIGAITTGGIYTLYKLRKPIIEGVKKSTAGGGKDIKEAGIKPIRTEYDFPLKLWYFIAIALGMIAMYWWVTESGVVAGTAMIILLIACFFFTAVAGYLAGIVGSSNNPISGVTVTTLLFTGLLLLLLCKLGYVSVSVGMTATIIVGAVVCCSAAIAGDSMQELKTGQLVGATPFNIQVARFIGVLIAAMIIPFVVALIIQAYGILNGPPGYDNPLAAPQATVMAAITQGVFLGKMNWIMFGVGVIIAIILILLELSVMAVAIGIYLPFTLTAPIMLGGLLKYATEKFIERRVKLYGDMRALATNPGSTAHASNDEKRSDNPADKGAITKRLLGDAENKGILFASGLVAGEAIMGVIVAAFVIAGISLNIIHFPIGWPGLILFLYLMLLFGYFVLRDVLRDLRAHEIKSVGKSLVKGTIERIMKQGK